MVNAVIVATFIFLVAVSMTMVGKGGGNFYVVILALTGAPMHEAATTGQFILFTASVAAITVYHRNNTVVWPLAVTVGGLMAISAFFGGYFSHVVSGFVLKVLFAAMLLIAGGLMLVPIRNTAGRKPRSRFGSVTPIGPNKGNSIAQIFGNAWGTTEILLRASTLGERDYHVNPWIVVPVVALTGFASGMVGVSGGSFLMPLLVLLCGVPMHTAVGTASVVIAASAVMGFTGHALQGDFNPSWAIPLATVTVVGGLLGGCFALQTKPKYLRQVFAYTNWLAALALLVGALNAK